MKHLRRYNESFSKRMTTEEINTMLDTIEDIFLDIKDDGYHLDYSGPILKLTITKPKETVLGKMGVTFKLGDISNVVHHLYNYLITIDKLQFNKMSILKIATNRTSSGRSIGMTNYIKIDELDESSDFTIDELDESSDFTIDELTIKFDETFLKDYGLPTASELDDLSGHNESLESLDADYIKDLFFSCYEDLFDNFAETVDPRITRMSFVTTLGPNGGIKLDEEVKDNTLYVRISECQSTAGTGVREPSVEILIYTSFDTRYLGARVANPFSMESTSRRSKFLETFGERLEPHQLYLMEIRTMDLYHRVEGNPDYFKVKMREQRIIIK